MTAVCGLGYKQAAARRAADQAHTLPLQQTMANLKRGGRAFALTRLQAARLRARFLQGLPFAFLCGQFIVFACDKTPGDIAPSSLPSLYTLKSSNRTYFLSSSSRSLATTSSLSISVSIKVRSPLEHMIFPPVFSMYLMI